MFIPPTPGSYLRRKREEVGIALRDVARIIGVTVSYVSDIERGKRRLPREKDLLQWCALIGASLETVQLLEIASDLKGAFEARCPGNLRQRIDQIAGLFNGTTSLDELTDDGNKPIDLRINFTFTPPKSDSPYPDNLGLWKAFSEQFADSLLSSFNEWIVDNHPGAEDDHGIRGSCTGLLGDTIQKRFQQEADWHYNLERQS